MFDVPSEAMVNGMLTFLLVFFRLTGMFVVAPFLSSTSLPIRMRIWLATWLAIALTPAVLPMTPDSLVQRVLHSDVTMLYAVATEMMIGWLLGLVVAAIVLAAQLTGHLVGLEIGLSIGEILDPVTETASSPTANLFSTVASVIFVVTNGHITMFRALRDTFAFAPPGSFYVPRTELFGETAATIGQMTFDEGVRLALPTMGALLVATVGIAVLARAVPEMNVFVLGFAIRIIVGFIALVVFVPFFVERLMATYLRIGETTGEFLQVIGR